MTRCDQEAATKTHAIMKGSDGVQTAYDARLVYRQVLLPDISLPKGDRAALAEGWWGTVWTCRSTLSSLVVMTAQLTTPRCRSKASPASMKIRMGVADSIYSGQHPSGASISIRSGPLIAPIPRRTSLYRRNEDVGRRAVHILRLR